MEKIILDLPESIQAKALLIGQNINIKKFGKKSKIAIDPIVIAVQEAGYAAIFRYGVIVTFNLNQDEEKRLLEEIKPFLTDPFPAIETEEVSIYQNNNNTAKVDGGTIFLPELTVNRLQIIADTLAKSVVLAYYESEINNIFYSIEPFAIDLQNAHWNKRQVKELIKQLGKTLLFQHKMVGRVQVIDKPELLWEYSELERFYVLLEKEYEIEDRHSILERKLELISRTAETALSLLQHNKSMLVEWYIVILIVMELVLSVYKIFF